MKRYPLGRTDMSIPAIGLGSAPFGREIDEDASYAILDAAVERGITWIDTAESYGGGDAQAYRRKYLGIDDVREQSSEKSSAELIIGRWMKKRGNRDAVQICTKVSTGGSPDNIRRCFDASLERLQVDRVECYMLHNFDAATPLDETLAAMNELVTSGRAVTIGCSNFDLAQTKQAVDVCDANGWARFAVHEPIYNLARPEFAGDLFPYCREQGITITAYSPLAAGFLAGKYTPDRDSFPKGTRFDIIPGHADVYFSDRNFRVVEKLRAKADELGVPMVRLAMAWAMAHPDVDNTLVGCRTKAHIDNAVEAMNMSLAADLLAEMTAWD